MGSVNFQIEGEFVCDLARVWFWDEGREYSKCEELLLSCLVTDQITLEEKKKIVVEILEGRKKLVGVNSLSLVDDGTIRPLTDKIEEYRKNEIIRKIEEDIQRRPLAYLDPYSCDQDPADFEPISDDLNYDDRKEIREIYGKYLTPYEDLRLWAYSSDSYFYGRRLLPGFWSAEDRPYLDQGLYLIERPRLVFELIGGPVKDTDKLMLLLRDFLQALVDRKGVNQAAALEIIHRNKKFAAAQEEKRRQIPKPEEKELTEDDLNKRTDPDDFLSEYGLILPGIITVASLPVIMRRRSTLSQKEKAKIPTYIPAISTRRLTYFILKTGRLSGIQIRAVPSSSISGEIGGRQRSRLTPRLLI